MLDEIIYDSDGYILMEEFTHVMGDISLISFDNYLVIKTESNNEIITFSIS